MSRRDYIGKRVVVIMLALSMAVTGSGLHANNANAADPYVQGSYAAAMKFADEFCSDTSNAGVGPTYNGIGDLVWITAPGGGGTITANRGDLYAPVEVHIAGKFCGGYSGSNGGSDYRSDRGSISGRLMYGGNTANAVFNVSKAASLYIGDIGQEGTYRINMSLSSFYTLPGGGSPTPKDSPNAWTDLVIDYTDRWSINGQSYIKKSTDAGRSQGIITANLNETVYWYHDLRNAGPDNMERDLYYNVDKSGYSGGEAGINGNKAQNGFARGDFNQLFVALYAPNSPYTVKTIGQQDVGAGYNGRAPICQRIAWQDKAWNDGSWGWSIPSACVRVPYNYNLIPGVTGVSGVASVGSPILQVRSNINNALPSGGGQTTVSEMAHWERWRIEVPPNGSIPLAQQENGSIPCAHYGNISCIPKGNGDQVFGAINTSLPSLDDEMVNANTPVGTRICYTVSVKPYTQSNANWRHSAPACVTVSKQPKLQVWGGDVRTRGNIETNTTLINDAGGTKLFGSWVEYGGFSVGANDGFASGANFNNGTTNTTGASEWHKLTFANVDNSGPSFGGYTLSGLPTITDQFIGGTSGGAFNSNLGALNSGTYAVGSVTIDASSIGQDAGIGKSIIIVSSGTVTIDGDVAYTGTSGDTFTAVNQIPQVVIIANAINITNNVGRVDAWLLTRGASGTINTCSDRAVTAPLNSTVCNRPLTINGPVATEHLYLRRTAGSDNAASANAPAEVLNLRADAYVWAYARASQAGKAQTVDSIELPPRF